MCLIIVRVSIIIFYKYRFYIFLEMERTYFNSRHQSSHLICDISDAVFNHDF